jgi:hypothetical protein
MARGKDFQEAGQARQWRYKNKRKGRLLPPLLISRINGVSIYEPQAYCQKLAADVAGH